MFYQINSKYEEPDKLSHWELSLKECLKSPQEQGPNHAIFWMTLRLYKENNKNFSKETLFGTQKSCRHKEKAIIIVKGYSYIISMRVLTVHV